MLGGVTPVTGKEFAPFSPLLAFEDGVTAVYRPQGRSDLRHMLPWRDSRIEHYQPRPPLDSGMRRSVRAISIAAACIAGAAACSRFRHQSSPSYSVRTAGSRAPATATLAAQYGCTTDEVAANWQTARLTIAQPGTPICRVLGRYGNPISVSRSNVADMQLVSMLHREANGRYYNATFVYYADTKANRKLNRPIGRWIVDRVTASR